MKILKWFFSLIVLLIILVSLVVFIFLKTLDLPLIQAKITNAISVAIDKAVTLEELDFSFSFAKGVVLDLYGVKIEQEEQTDEQIDIYIKNIRLDIDFFSYLRKREILVSSVNIQSPNIRLIKALSSEKNFSKNLQGSSRSLSHPDNSHLESQQETLKDLPHFIINSIKIQNGTVAFRDLSQNPPSSFDINHIDISADNISLLKPFDFILKCSVLSEEKNNVQLKGQAQLAFENKQVRFDDVEFSSDLSRLSISLIRQALPSIEQIPIDDSIAGLWNNKISQMVIGEEGLLLLALEGELKDGKIVFKDMAHPLSQIQLQYSLSEVDLENLKFSAKFNESQLSGQVAIDDYKNMQKYQVFLEVQNLFLDDLVQINEYQEKIKGTINTKFDIKGTGFDKDHLLETLKGEGDFSLTNGKLNDVNMLRFFLQNIRIPGIVNIYDSFENYLLQKYREELVRNDTLIKQFTGKWEVHDKHVSIKNIKLESEEFILMLSGGFSSLQHVKLQEGRLFLTRDLAQRIIEKEDAFQVLLDKEQRIEIPLMPYEGDMNSIKLIPDFEYIGKKFVVKKGKDEIQKIINKVFDYEEKSPTPNTQEIQKPPSEKDSKSTEEEIIENIINIFQDH